MTQNNSKPSYSPPNIEDAMNKILKKRTGKKLRRNVQSAKLPQPEKLDEDDFASAVFDNLMKKREQEIRGEYASEQSEEIQENVQSEAAASYYDEMDSLLFGGGNAQELEAEALAEESQGSPYDLLDDVLSQMDQKPQTQSQEQASSPPPQSHDEFSRTLDDLLDLH